MSGLVCTFMGILMWGLAGWNFYHIMRTRHRIVPYIVWNWIVGFAALASGLNSIILGAIS